MPNDYENPKYTNKNEYHAGDGPFQFQWWAIVIAFVVWKYDRNASLGTLWYRRLLTALLILIPRSEEHTSELQSHA